MKLGCTNEDSAFFFVRAFDISKPPSDCHFKLRCLDFFAAVGA